MKALALKNVTWKCNGNVYKCLKGQEVEIISADLLQAKASKLFEIKEVKKTTTKRTKKAE